MATRAPHVLSVSLWSPGDTLLAFVRHAFSIVGHETAIPASFFFFEKTSDAVTKAATPINSLEQDSEHVRLHVLPPPVLLCEIPPGICNLTREIIVSFALVHLAVRTQRPDEERKNVVQLVVAR